MISGKINRCESHFRTQSENFSIKNSCHKWYRNILVIEFLLLWENRMKSNLDKKNLFQFTMPRSYSINEGNQIRNQGRKSAAYSLAFHGFLSLLSYRPWDYKTMSDSMDNELPHQLLMKNMYHIFASRSILRGHILSWGSYFPNNSNLWQIYPNFPYISLNSGC